MKKYSWIICFIISTSTWAQAPNCESKSLFSGMPNHEVNQCKSKEFDSYTFYKSKPDGNYETLTKEGAMHEIWYTWKGAWEERPSNIQILRNYQNAIEKQSGQLLCRRGDTQYFKLSKSGNTYWIEVRTDGSGSYSITTIEENEMKQDVVYNAVEIKKRMETDGQITFYGIYFDVNKATIKPESATSIKEIAAYLKGNAQRKVFLVGHTDNTGTHENNMKLSKDRADAVVNELISNYAIPASQVTSKGVGELSPVANNNTEDDKAKNRRVVMVLRK